MLPLVLPHRPQACPGLRQSLLMDGLGVEPQQMKIQVDQQADARHGENSADSHLAAQQPAGQDGETLRAGAAQARRFSGALGQRHHQRVPGALPKALPHQPVTVDHGHKTHYGYQNLTTDGQRLLGFLYAAGNPFGGVILDRNLNVLKLLPFAAGNGIDLLPRNLQEDGKPRRFVRCRTLHNWRKTDVANDPPQVILEFFELRDDNTLAPLHKATAK